MTEPIIVALKKDDPLAFSLLVQNIPDPQTRQFILHESLLMACRGRFPKIQNHLLSLPDIDVNYTDRYGRTPLLLAIRTQQLELCFNLIAMANLDLNHSDDIYSTPLHYAIDVGLIPLVKALLLLNQGCSHFNINQQNLLGRSVFSMAIEKGFTEVVSKILEIPTLDPNTLLIRHKPPIYMAIALDHMDIFKALVADKRTNINQIAGKSLASPLLYAIERGQLPYVEILLQHPYLDFFYKNVQGLDALSLCIHFGQIDCFRVCLASHRFDLNQITPGLGNRIMQIIKLNDFDRVATLLNLLFESPQIDATLPLGVSAAYPHLTRLKTFLKKYPEIALLWRSVAIEQSHKSSISLNLGTEPEFAYSAPPLIGALPSRAPLEMDLSHPTSLSTPAGHQDICLAYEEENEVELSSVYYRVV